MHINRVLAHNFKGQSIDRTIGPVTVILGDNFAGKTSIADAIRLSLSGYLPAIGKTSPLLWSALAGNPEAEGTMDTQVYFDTGRTSKLTFSRNKKGSIALEGAVPSDLALDPMLLDVRQFFRLTAEQRTAAIFAAAGDVQIKTDDIEKTLWGIEAMPVAHRDTVLRDLTAEVLKAFKAEPSPQRTCEKLTAAWKERLKDVKAREKIASGAFAGMKLPQVMPAYPDGLEEAVRQRDDLLVKRGELTALLRDDQRVAQLEVIVRQKTEELEAARKALEEEPAPGEQPSQPTILIEYEAAQTEIAELRERLRVVNEEHARVKAEHARMEGVDLCPCCGLKGGMDRARENLAKRLVELTESGAQATKALEEILEPFDDIRSVGAEFAEAKQEYAQATQRLADLKTAVATAEAGLDRAKAELEKLTGDRHDRVKVLTEAVAGLPPLETRITEMKALKTEFDNYQSLIREREKREQECLRMGCEVTVLDGAVKGLSALIAKVSEEVFAKVLGLSDAFTSGLINSPLKFRDGELGREVSEADQAMGRKAPLGSWIPHTSFSGTEELLAMAGFAVALARMAPFKLVILDELGRLTADRRSAVVKRVKKLVADGVIDQVVLIDAGSDAKAYSGKGITLISW